MKRFRIAFSFAGEKRDFVAKVAAILAQRFGEETVLYDKYHEAEFARHDLGIYLPKLYGEQSDLIVPVLCRNYDKKRWTGWEWLAHLRSAHQDRRLPRHARAGLNSRKRMGLVPLPASSNSTTKRRSKRLRSSSNASP